MAITKVTVPVARSCKTGALTRALGANKTADKVAALSWSKKLASQKKRQALSDFQRFQVMVLRKKRSTILKKAVKAELKAKGKK